MSFAPPPRPYPPARYTGDAGEVSARLRPDDTPHDLVTAAGHADYLAVGDATGGGFGLYRWHMSGAPTGPGPHFHRTMTESFYVLDGEVRLFDGAAWRTGHPGDFLFVPEGGIHGFRNESGAPATMLILFTPGAPRERYFEGLVELGGMSERPSAEAMAEFYREHDNIFVE